MNGQFIWRVYSRKLWHQHIKISVLLHLIKAQERLEKSPPKKDSSSSQMRLLGGTPHMYSKSSYREYRVQTLYFVQPNPEGTDTPAAAGLHLAPGEDTRIVFFKFDIDVHGVWKWYLKLVWNYLQLSRDFIFVSQNLSWSGHALWKCL